MVSSCGKRPAAAVALLADSLSFMAYSVAVLTTVPDHRNEEIKMNSIHSLIKAGIASCLLLALLAACGQRGPLYLPDKKSAPVPVQQQQQDEDELKQPSETGNDSGSQ